MPDPRTNSKRPQRLAERYAMALAGGDEAASGEAIQDALTDGWTLGQIYSRLLTPAHARVRQLTAGRAANGAQRNLATQITLSHMERLRSRLRVHQKHGRTVVVAVIEKGEHALEASMMSDLLRSDGWTVDAVGSAVPLKALLQLLLERKADLLAIPGTSGVKVQTVRRIAKRVQGLPDPPTIILGGSPWGHGDGNELEIAGVRIAMDFEEVLRIGRERLAARGGEGGLAAVLKTLGSRIRATRRGLPLTQQQLAEKANLDRTYIVAVERGRQNVTVGAVMRIAEALNVSIDELLVSEETKTGKATGSTDRDHASIDN